MKQIALSKPNITKLKSKGYNLIDMHIHTSASLDCSLSLQSVLKKAKKMGIGIAIADHDKIDSAISAVNNNLDILVIPSIEVSAKNDRHVLFYFYNENELIKFYNNEIKNKPLRENAEDLVKLKDRYNCIVGLAHPTGYRLWHNFKIKHYIKKTDFLEVLNGTCSKKRTLKAYSWALKYKKGVVGGSDAHKLSNIGRCMTCTKGKTVKNVLESIKRNKTLVAGLPLSHKEQLKELPKELSRFALLIMALFKKQFKKNKV